MNSIEKWEVKIPQYITHVKFAEHHQKKSFREGDKIPKKYTDNSRYVFKGGKLFDKEEKVLVAKNQHWIDKPRFEAISGNEIYARMHEQKRIQIVGAIKDSYKDPIKTARLPAPFDMPVRISMTLCCPPRACDWDLDNLWIYFKCFQDTLVDTGHLKDDSVLHITKSGCIEYYPVKDEGDRLMIFHIVHETRVEILGHTMYNLVPREPSFIGDIATAQDIFELLETSDGKPGDTLIEASSNRIVISSGKRETVYGGVKRGLSRVFAQSVNMDIKIQVHRSFYEKYKQLIHSELLDKGIIVLIYERGNEVSRSVQDESVPLRSDSSR